MNAEHKRRCESECTRDAIFLLQRRFWKRTGDVPGTEYDGEGFTITDRDEVPEWAEPFIVDEDGCDPYVSDSPGLAVAADKYGAEIDTGWPLFYEHWETVSVWLDRDEATAWAESHHYRFTDGWRVYSVCAEGELAKRLRDFVEVVR